MQKITQVYKEADRTQSSINKIYKSLANVLDQVMRSEKFEHLVTIGMVEKYVAAERSEKKSKTVDLQES